MSHDLGQDGTESFILQQRFFFGIYFGITLHDIYRKNVSAEIFLSYITFS